MVEVALKGYISVHRRHGTDLTTPADSYMPALSACTVVYVPEADLRYFQKKDKGGFDL